MASSELTKKRLQQFKDRIEKARETNPDVTADDLGGWAEFPAVDTGPIFNPTMRFRLGAVRKWIKREEDLVVTTSTIQNIFPSPEQGGPNPEILDLHRELYTRFQEDPARKRVPSTTKTYATMYITQEGHITIRHDTSDPTNAFIITKSDILIVDGQRIPNMKEQFYLNGLGEFRDEEILDTPEEFPTRRKLLAEQSPTCPELTTPTAGALLSLRGIIDPYLARQNSPK